MLKEPPESTDLRQRQHSTLQCLQICNHLIHMSGDMSNGVVVFLHWLCFVIIERSCHLLEFKMYGTVERRLPPRLHAVFRNIGKQENQFVNSPRDSDLLRNVMGSFFFFWLMIHPATKTHKNSS